MIMSTKSDEEETRDDITEIITNILGSQGNRNIQQSGCRTLSFLANENENNIIIAKEEGIETIIRAMNVHISRSNVRIEAFKALNKLARRNIENTVTISVEGGIVVIINARKRHIKYTELQMEACQGLYTFLCINENQQIIAKNGGMQIII